MIFNRDGITSQSVKKPRSAQIIDSEFGSVSYKRSSNANFVRIRVLEDGTIKASLPKRAPLYLVNELLDSSREEIRGMVQAQLSKVTPYIDGMSVGRSHRLHLTYEATEEPKKSVRGQSLYIVLPERFRSEPQKTQQYISRHVKNTLKKEAMAYLPRRLRYLADEYGFKYTRERFGHQRGRWGSCSSNGTISLNVALMNLSLELIDYVLIHELAHTRQMNHSTDFWEIVAQCMPDYKERRKILKTMSPIC